jgi:hypothetical protein
MSIVHACVDRSIAVGGSMIATGDVNGDEERKSAWLWKLRSEIFALK